MFEIDLKGVYIVIYVCTHIFLILYIHLPLTEDTSNEMNISDSSIFARMLFTYGKHTYIYIYIHTHAYIYIYIFLNAYTCIHIYLYIYI